MHPHRTVLGFDFPAGRAIAVQAHDWQERAELEPAHEEFPVVRVIGTSAREAADVGGEPWDAGHPHVDTRGQLLT